MKLLKPKQLINSLINKPDLIKEYELYNVVSFIATIRNYNYYDELLSLLVLKKDSLEIKESKFIGCGAGAGSFNAYRKVRVENDYFFEKIYFNNSIELSRIIWFYNNIYDELMDALNIPKIKKIVNSNMISIIYTDYIQLQKIPKNEINDKLINISKILYSHKIEASYELNNLPEIITDYKLHFAYQNQTILALNNENIDRSMFENLANKSKRVLSHGDLQITNLFKDNYIIDWDAFGIYPIGFEQALMYFRLIIEERESLDYLAWLDKNYRVFVEADDWNDFERNFTFFLYVFSLKLFAKDMFLSLKEALIKSLNKYRSI